MVLTTYSTGRVLGDRYRLLWPLGTGASAHVFVAEDMRLARRVAVKVLLPGLAQDELFLRRFGREARAAASLNHPHVVRVFDWGEDDDGPYLVLEYLGGGTLARLLSSGRRLSVSQAVRVGKEAAEGLAYVHCRGIVHRDIKPANLLFDEDGHVRVGDFGVARALARSAWAEPTGAVVGTPRYLAPEQARGGPVDGRADVYALGLVLFESVTRVLPSEADPSARSTLGPLAEVLGWATDRDQEHRPAAADFARRLDLLGSRLALPAALALAPPWAGAGSRAGPEPPGRRRDLTAMAALGALGTATRRERATVVVGHGPPAKPRPPVRKRGQALPWVLVCLSVAALLVAGAVYAVRERLFVPSHPVPGLAGLTVAQAVRALGPDHFELEVTSRRYSTSVAAGQIIRQEPAPEQAEKQGTTIAIVVSKGLPSESIPSLSDLDCAVARRMLRLVSLFGTCPATAEQFSSTVPQGEIITWSYGNQNQPGRAPWHSTITISVSEGPPPVTIPQVAGMRYDQAAADLSGDGLKVSEQRATSSQYANGAVVSTSPAAGRQVPQGTTVTVTVSSGSATGGAGRHRGG